MAKKETSSKGKLAMVKGTAVSMALVAGIAQAIPAAAKLKKLTRPPLLKIDTIPIETAVSGVILGIRDSISDKPSMKDAKLIHLSNQTDPKNPVEFYVPMTGVIKNAVGDVAGIEKLKGETLWIVRQPDGVSEKYNGNKMFMFDVYIEESGK